MNKVIQIKKCMACNSKKLYKFIDFGPMPIPNIYLTRKDLMEKPQLSFYLDAYLCKNCGLVQLGQIVPEHDVFANNYTYKTPEAMRNNFLENVKETISMASLKKGSKILEIGGGIGIPLQEYKKLGMKVLGVDPALGVARQANKLGIKTIAKHFDLKVAKEIVRKNGKFNVITAANVLQHIPDIKGTFQSIAYALEKQGVFVLEFPYLEDILKDLAFDSFYAEHYYYLSLAPLQKMFEKMGLTIINAKRLPNIHLGSMRIWVKHKAKDTAQGVEILKMLKDEKDSGFSDPQTYANFSKRINTNMHELLDHLYIAKNRGDRIVAHGASAKFVTLTNYGHIGADLIEYVADAISEKQGKFTPGMGIPVVTEEKLLKDAPDLIICGARNFYNYAKPLYDKIKKKNPKAKILIPIPEVIYK